MLKIRNSLKATDRFTGRQAAYDRDMSDTMSRDEALNELENLSNPKVLQANLKRGDNHGINLSQLRALAKRVKVNHERAQELWNTGETGARLLAILTCIPKKFSADELDAMLRQTQGPKEVDWLESYVIKKSLLTDELRNRWWEDDDPHVQAGAWKLLNLQVGNQPEAVDFNAVLEEIESRMADAPARLQWAMNEVLAQIGITQPDYRSRAINIGEKLQVLADYPVSRGCTSPFAPIWIRAIVEKQA